MELISFKAKNFLSFREIEYTFLNGEPVLILGENKTDEGQESNGSGKSALVAGIEMCIEHSTSQNVNDSDLIYWGQDQSDLSLSINCPLRGETMLIERVLTLKGSMAQLSINGAIIFSFEDKQVKEIDKYIIEWLGISKEDLQNFYIISKFRYVSFFDASNTALINLIGRFSNSNIIAGVDKDIMREAEALESDRVLLTEKKNKLLGKLEVYQTSENDELTLDKQELVQRAIDDIDNKILVKGEEILVLKERTSAKVLIIEGFHQRLINCTDGLDTANKSLKTASMKDGLFDSRYAEVDVKIDSEKQAKEHVEAKLTNLVQNYKEVAETFHEIELNLMKSVECPKCHHKFVVGVDVDVYEEEEAKASCISIIASLDKSMADIKTSIAEFDPKIQELKRGRISIEAEENEVRLIKRNINASIVNIEREKAEIEAAIAAAKATITGFNTQVADIQQVILELEKSKGLVTMETFDNKDRLQAIRQQIIECKTSMIDVEAEDEVLKEAIFDKRQWAYTFKEFTQFLSVKTLKVLQSYANKFLTDMKSDLRVELSGYMMKKDGTLSDKITANIVRDGKSKKSGNFSGGERARLEAAMILTIKRAININHPYGGLNFTSIDEIMESIDSMGVNVLIDSLKGLKQTILITTHVPITAYDCNVLKVVKENGISRIN